MNTLSRKLFLIELFVPRYLKLYIIKKKRKINLSHRYKLTIQIIFAISCKQTIQKSQLTFKTRDIAQRFKY